MTGEAWQLELARPAWLYALALLPLALYGVRGSLLSAGAARRIAMTAVRALVLAAAILVFAGPRLVQWEDRPSVVALRDVSASIGPEGKQKADAFLASLQSQAGSTPVTVVPFASQPMEESPTPDRKDDARDLATNLAAALVHAQPLVPADRTPRIIVLSDGLENQGDALAVARRQGDPLFVVPLAAWPPGELAVEGIRAATFARVGEPVQIIVSLRALESRPATVVLECEGTEVARQEVRLASGPQMIGFRHAPPRAGPLVYRARIIPGSTDEGNDPRSDAAETMAFVHPRPRVLLVDPQPAPANRLAEVLERDGIEVDVVAPAAIPARADDLGRYDAVLLSNVPAEALSAEQVEALDTFVRLGGGGLIALGGDQAFTPGGYRGTPLERMLPVWSHVRVKEDHLTLALVLVIDRSESMRGESIALAREAARRAVEAVEADAQVGILVFDEQTRWVARLEPRDDRRAVLDAIATIEAGGRTDVYTAMEKAFLALRDALADLKHMIVLSDGISHPGDFHALVRAIGEEGITVSTVGLGREAQGPLLPEIAALGQGRYYAVRDASAVPNIFALEARSAGRQGITEGASLPRLTQTTAALEGIDFAAAPSLLGYAETRAKPGSQVLLASDFGDPLLARWRYGLGTTVAFASDASSRWSAAWLQWQSFEPFWQRLVRDALRRDMPGALAVETAWRGGEATVSVDALDQEGIWVNGLHGQLNVAGGKVVPLVQIAPGRYEARFVPERAGLEHGNLTLSSGNTTQHAAWSVDCGVPDELTLGTDDGGLLRELVRVTGGKYDPRPEEVLAAKAAPLRRTRSLEGYLLALAVALFALDLLLRRPVW